MHKKLKEALEAYQLEKADCRLIRHNENKVYEVLDGPKRYLLRIHEAVEGYSLSVLQNKSSLASHIQGELDVLKYMDRLSGMRLQRPILNQDGMDLTLLSGGACVSVLSWIEGETLKALKEPDFDYKRVGYMFLRMGTAMSHLDQDNGQPAFRHMSGYDYGPSLLGRMEKALIEALEVKHIKAYEIGPMTSALKVIYEGMLTLRDRPLAYGMVHGDLSPSNMIVTDASIVPIDFSLFGYGYKWMDMGFLLAHFEDLSIRRSILEGYEEGAGSLLDIRLIEGFFALSILLFIVSQHERVWDNPWFREGIERWNDQVMMPLVNGQSFLI